MSSPNHEAAPGQLKWLGQRLEARWPAERQPRGRNKAIEQQSRAKERKGKQSGPVELQKCHFHWRSRRGRRQNGRLRAGGASGGGEEVASRPGEGSVCVSRALCSRCSLLAARRSPLAGFRRAELAAVSTCRFMSLCCRSPAQELYCVTPTPLRALRAATRRILAPTFPFISLSSLLCAQSRLNSLLSAPLQANLSLQRCHLAAYLSLSPFGLGLGLGRRQRRRGRRRQPRERANKGLEVAQTGCNSARPAGGSSRLARRWERRAAIEHQFARRPASCDLSIRRAAARWRRPLGRNSAGRSGWRQRQSESESQSCAGRAELASAQQVGRQYVDLCAIVYGQTGWI